MKTFFFDATGDVFLSDFKDSYIRALSRKTLLLSAQRGSGTGL